MSITRYWIVVASKDHVVQSRESGFMQIDRLNPDTLSRINCDDWIIYYSPTTTFNTSKPCQAFTAIAKVMGESFSSQNIGSDFKSFQRQLEFFDCRELPISSLITNLNFITNKRNWGYKFRFGILEIQAPDFELIRSHMLPFENGTEVKSVERNAPEHGSPI